ncbi:MAG: type VI secretion system tip protein VgrG [Mariprofundus sp.]|nr:type VI secretion system tip protein VgrG [Mariprofundus sp.]
MSNNREISQPASTDLPTWRIMIDGVEISGEIHLMSILVSKSVNKIPRARLEFLDGDVATESFVLSDADFFLPGNEIEILAGYHSDESSIFKGKVTAHGLKSRAGKPSKLTVDCCDDAIMMTLSRKNAYFQELSDSDIFETIITAYDLDIDIPSTDLIHPEMVQYNVTDWDFLLERAEANGRLIIVDDGVVAVKQPDTSANAELSLILGSTMLEFEAQIDARYQLPDVTGRSWHFSDQAIAAESGTAPEMTESGNLSGSDLASALGQTTTALGHTGFRSDQEMQAWADSRLSRSRLAKIIGRVKCQGYAAIKPGQMMELRGVGERFNGNVLVTAIRHQFNVNNWETDIQFGLSPQRLSQQNDVPDTPAAGLVPPVHGLHIGVVTQLEDPEGEDRVRVRMPMVDPDDEGIWARIASLDAGDTRGAFFRPEIDDEVVLGFLNDDPRDPIILGMLNSSVKPAPISASDDNPEKGFVTRSGMKLIFDDDAISLNIETPKGNKINLSDDEGSIVLEDENGNKVEMNGDGITIESRGNISIRADQDVNIEGSNVILKANLEFKAEGSAGAELTSGGVAKLTGTQVHIN